MEAEYQNINMERLVRILSGEANASEIVQHKLWLEGSEANRKSFMELEKVWRSMDKTSASNSIDIESEWSKLKTEAGIRSGKGFRSFILQPVFRIAAGVLILVSLSIAGWLYLSSKTIST